MNDQPSGEGQFVPEMMPLRYQLDLATMRSGCPVKRLYFRLCNSWIALLLVFSLLKKADAQDSGLDEGNLALQMMFDPVKIAELLQETEQQVQVNYRYTGLEAVALKVESRDPGLAIVKDEIYELERVESNHAVNYIASAQVNKTTSLTLVVKGVFLGRTHLEFFTNVSLKNYTDNADKSREISDKEATSVLKSKNGDRTTPNGKHWHKLPTHYDVAVVRKDGPLNKAFMGAIILLIVLANVAMGCKVDLDAVKQNVRRPIAPGIGLFCQFIIMPLLGFAASQLFDFEPGVALGLFATGCAPGGGASNAYTYLLGGDVSLSVTMTFISNLVAFAMVPLWLLTLGTMYIYKGNAGIRIPYENIFVSLAGLIIPVFIGIVIQRKRPQWTRLVLRMVVPLMILSIIVVFSIGIYANLYIFKLLRPDVLAAGAILPNFGFLLGGVIAVVCRQPWKQVKTIAVETGLQNTGIPIVLLSVSLPHPDSDLAIVAPIAAAIFTPILLWIWIGGRMFWKRFCHVSEKVPISSNDLVLSDDEQITPALTDKGYTSDQFDSDLENGNKTKTRI